MLDNFKINNMCSKQMAYAENRDHIIKLDIVLKMLTLHNQIGKANIINMYLVQLILHWNFLF